MSEDNIPFNGENPQFGGMPHYGGVSNDENVTQPGNPDSYGGQMPNNGQAPYGGQIPNNGQAPYGGQMPYNSQAPFGGQTPYNGSNPFNSPYNQSAVNRTPYGEGPEPPKKSNVGLIIGLAVGGTVLVFALLIFGAVSLIKNRVEKVRGKYPDYADNNITTEFYTEYSTEFYTEFSTEFHTEFSTEFPYIDDPTQNDPAKDKDSESTNPSEDKSSDMPGLYNFDNFDFDDFDDFNVDDYFKDFDDFNLDDFDFNYHIDNYSNDKSSDNSSDNSSDKKESDTEQQKDQEESIDDVLKYAELRPDYFNSHKWLESHSSSYLVPESDGTFKYYQDKNVTDNNYYSGHYKLYTGADALNYICNDEEMAKYGVTQNEVNTMIERSSDYSLDNFVCLVLINEECIIDGKNTLENNTVSPYFGFYIVDSETSYLDIANMNKGEYYWFKAEE